MVLADEQAGGQHRDKIRDAFQRHNIQLGANALLAPSAVLAGARRPGRAAAVGARDEEGCRRWLGATRAPSSRRQPRNFGGQRFAQVVHTQRVALGGVDKRLKGVTVTHRSPSWSATRAAGRR